jgi:NADPH:quinone reductase-like Zn-dependent oxidoreductase
MHVMGQRSWARGAPLEWIELPTPEPRRGEVRVAVHAIGVNPVDWKMRSFGPLRVAARLIGPPPPVVVGVDFAGVVEAVGPDVTDVAVGSRVVGGTDFSRGQRGSYADTVVVAANQVCVLPDNVDFTTAGALPVTAVTAWLAIVELGRLRPGDKALILGASGGVGQLAVQVARLVGGSAVGVCSAKNTDFVAGLGAEAVLDYGAGDPLEAARAHGPFRVVVDCVGGYSGSACRALLGPGGRHVMVAADGPGAFLELLRAPATSRAVLGKPTAARLEPVVAAVADGSLRVRIEQTLPLVEAEEAHRISQTGRLTGKLVLLPRPG